VTEDDDEAAALRFSCEAFGVAAFLAPDGLRSLTARRFSHFLEQLVRGLLTWK
jgi:hypothetical protein